jgi:thiosulfate/3-mercaptopyruvate sulfurtransferase
MFAALAMVALASAGRAQSLVDPMWVAERADDPEMVLLHVGTPSGYETGHLPNARLITVADVSAPGSLPQPGQPPGESAGLMFEIGDADSVAGKLASLGVTEDSEIVLYSETGQPLPSTTRVAFALSYFGLGENVRLLNGGTGAWLAAGFEMSNAAPAASSVTSLRLTPHENLIVDASDVITAAQRSDAKVIDARVPAFYDGEQESFGRTGHIAGAVSLPFDSLVDDLGRFDEAQLMQAFEEAGIEQGDSLVVYCHVGMRASQVLFAARLLGFDARLYDGSFQDWVANDRGDIE